MEALVDEVRFELTNPGGENLQFPCVDHLHTHPCVF